MEKGFIKIDVRDLKFAPWNYKKDDAQLLKRLKENIKRNGQIENIVVRELPDGKFEVVNGNHRLQAFLELGIKEVTAYNLGKITEAQAKRIAVELNETRFKNDPQRLQALLRELERQFEDLTSTIDLESFFSGTGIEEITKIVEEQGDYSEASEAEDEYNPVKNEPIKIIHGDLIELGRHRILCGDSFDEKCLDRVIDGRKIDVILTDPPYGMHLDPDFRNLPQSSEIAGHVKGKVELKKYPKVLNDNKNFNLRFWLEKFKNVKEQFWFGADYYSNNLNYADLLKGSWLVWDKRAEEGNENKNVMDLDFSLSEFELIWSRKKHKRQILRVAWMGLYGMQFEEEKGRRIHPNQKPVRLYVKIIERYLKPEHQVFLDPFLGSGSLLIALEKLGRTLIGLEYVPEYCQAIINRWVKYTGKSIIKINGQEIDWEYYKKQV